ncbi:hypothetical protein JKP88DRAFT_242828 [Tribonema minus]|uniref:Uncharacterized protein n=1 Tax=Tribonema minus TaxID=303371 RepID=A0A836CQJ6_9STRA|nr:hypothetical protein JKP88DRAFT_242828 [Tribonema minus]
MTMPSGEASSLPISTIYLPTVRNSCVGSSYRGLLQRCPCATRQRRRQRRTTRSPQHQRPEACGNCGDGWSNVWLRCSLHSACHQATKRVNEHDARRQIEHGHRHGQRSQGAAKRLSPLLQLLHTCSSVRLYGAFSLTMKPLQKLMMCLFACVAAVSGSHYEHYDRHGLDNDDHDSLHHHGLLGLQDGSPQPSIRTASMDLKQDMQATLGRAQQMWKLQRNEQFIFICVTIATVCYDPCLAAARHARNAGRTDWGYYPRPWPSYGQRYPHSPYAAYWWKWNNDVANDNQAEAQLQDLMTEFSSETCTFTTCHNSMGACNHTEERVMFSARGDIRICAELKAVAAAAAVTAEAEAVAAEAEAVAAEAEAVAADAEAVAAEAAAAVGAARDEDRHKVDHGRCSIQACSGGHTMVFESGDADRKQANCHKTRGRCYTARCTHVAQTTAALAQAAC